jgi:hypothetical protein
MNTVERAAHAFQRSIDQRKDGPRRLAGDIPTLQAGMRDGAPAFRDDGTREKLWDFFQSDGCSGSTFVAREASSAVIGP